MIANRFRKGLVVLAPFISLLALFITMPQIATAKNFTISSSYLAELQGWRQDQENNLRSESGWLTVVGLHWLKEGKNSIGSEEGQAVILPQSAPKRLGHIFYERTPAQIEFLETKGVSLDGKSVETQRKYALRDDKSDKASVVKISTITFFLIKRKNGVGVRVKDTMAKARQQFKGQRWFEANPNLVIEATWHALEKPKKLMVPDVLGNVNEEEAVGYVAFTLNGKTYTLYPTAAHDGLFFVFRDTTAGKETYGAGRFLSTEPPKNGKVLLDFNRAVNPPCAFTPYATCPMPPSENQLPIAIQGGELVPYGH